MSRPHAWCDVLATASDDVIGTVLSALVTRLEPRHPELVALVHRRWSERSGEGDAWFLTVAVVLRASTPASTERVIDTHPALCREVIQTMIRWTHRHPNLERYAPGDPVLTKRFHLPRIVVLPDPPPPFMPDPPPPAKRAREVDVPPAVAPASPPPPPAPPPPSSQGSLF